MLSSRKDKNMTQGQLAEKMGVSINAVSKWERGLSFPDVTLYKDLCGELGICIEELINGKKNKYLEEFLDLIDVDLSKCAKPEYK